VAPHGACATCKQQPEATSHDPLSDIILRKMPASSCMRRSYAPAACCFSMQANCSLCLCPANRIHLVTAVATHQLARAAPYAMLFHLPVLLTALTNSCVSPLPLQLEVSCKGRTCITCSASQLITAVPCANLLRLILMRLSLCSCAVFLCTPCSWGLAARAVRVSLVRTLWIQRA
jgi:hypothetical protein